MFKNKGLSASIVSWQLRLDLKLTNAFNYLADSLADTVLLSWKRTSERLAKMARLSVSWSGIEFLRSSLSLSFTVLCGPEAEARAGPLLSPSRAASCWKLWKVECMFCEQAIDG